MIIAIDFDGTMHDGEYPFIGEPRKDVAEVLQALHEDGHTLILWTCRVGRPLDEALEWMERMAIPYDSVNEQDTSVLCAYGTDTRKVYADIYIDDHNLGGLPSWKTIYKKINSLNSI